MPLPHVVEHSVQSVVWGKQVDDTSDIGKDTISVWETQCVSSDWLMKWCTRTFVPNKCKSRMQCFFMFFLANILFRLSLMHVFTVYVHCSVYLCMWSLWWELGAVAAAGPAARHWCGWEQACCLAGTCVSAHLAPHWCGCHHHTPIPRNNRPRAVPAGAASSAGQAGALDEDRGACSPPPRPCRCTGVGSWAESPHCADTPGHWTHRVNPEPQLSSHTHNRKQSCEKNY